MRYTHTYPEILDMAARPDRAHEYHCDHGIGHPWPDGPCPEDPSPHACCDELEHCPRTWGRNIWERRERFRRIRSAGGLHATGRSPAQIATSLGVTQDEARRLIAIAKRMPEDKTPEERILESTLCRTDRQVLIDTLAGLHYTFGQLAHYPFEGVFTGTWDDVEHARFEGLLAEAEYQEIRAAVAAWHDFPIYGL